LIFQYFVTMFNQHLHKSEVELKVLWDAHEAHIDYKNDVELAAINEEFHHDL